MLLKRGTGNGRRETSTGNWKLRMGTKLNLNITDIRHIFEYTFKSPEQIMWLYLLKPGESIKTRTFLKDKS